MTYTRGFAVVGSLVLATAALDLMVSALAAFAWFDGNRTVAALFSAGAIAATMGFVVIAARKLRQVRRREA